MKNKTAVIIISVIIICLFAIQSTSFAQNNMLRKLGRGFANVATGAIEVPKAIQETFYEEGPIAAGSWGLFDGLYKFVARTVVGVYEIISFPIPLPADYAPIVEPEFLFSPQE
ncbi:MAG: exosortase system-associated protein, TIGR04073 family [Candidatus Omnitrophica bacterium]|nr:exosortase system-associated protein, TIGR04073 family [Candidatus Omnitrophota bacterium]